MINVCYLVDAPFLGGAERYVELIATHLDRTRFSPSVVMRKPDDGGSRLLLWKAALEARGIPVRCVPMDMPFSPFHLIGIHRAISSLDPRVVHANVPGPYDAQMGLLVPLARMCGALGVVVTEHLPMVPRLWKRALVKRISYNWVDKVVTVCRANVPYLVENQSVPREKVAVIHNALAREYGTKVRGSGEEVRRDHGIPLDRPVIAFVGNLISYKGLSQVAEVLSNLPDVPWHLVVAGDGSDRGPAEAILRKANRADRATFLGSVPAETVEKVLGACDVLTLPSALEGMPYVILEAMACSLPVVATRVFGIPEMVVDGETGLLIELGDSRALGAALAKVLTDPALRGEMGRRARERFEQLFTLDRQLGAIQDLYTSLAREGTT